jgi:putative tryptophan/tyrosine transport system substrate-binding protein
LKATKFILTTIVMFIPLLSSTAYAQDDENYTIGFLPLNGKEAFVGAMTELGYVEGQNVSYIFIDMEGFDESGDSDAYSAEFSRQRQAMIDAGADVFVTYTDSEAKRISTMAPETPVVFTFSIDPMETGVVADLVNPGGNVTGIVSNNPHQRRLQLLVEINSDTQKVYYPYIDTASGAEEVLQDVEQLTAELDLELVEAPFSDLTGGLIALNNIPEDADWVFLTNYTNLDYGVVELLQIRAAEMGVALAWVTDEPLPGFVMGYGPSIDASNRQAATIVDRILRGASPAELPVQTAENYLTVNLEAADGLDLAVPEIVLKQANTIMRPGDFEAIGASAQ